MRKRNKQFLRCRAHACKDAMKFWKSVRKKYTFQARAYIASLIVELLWHDTF